MGSVIGSTRWTRFALALAASWIASGCREPPSGEETTEGGSTGSTTAEPIDSTGTDTTAEPIDSTGTDTADGFELSVSPVKRFDFRWPAVAGVEHYRLLESITPGAPFDPLGEDIVGESVSVTMPLHFRSEASYLLQACNGGGCTDSASVSVEGSLAEAVGYFKASNTGESDYFGSSVALSSDGMTLAVGAFGEASGATGIDGDQADDSAPHAGAVYVFVRDAMGAWSQQAYIKASNAEQNRELGYRSLALSDDGNTLAVGGRNTEAAYVFARDEAALWSEQAHVEASNSDIGDRFGWSVALSGDGDTLAVGAVLEASSATGIDGDQADDSAVDAGAVYLFERDAADQWSQQAYVKASNTDAEDQFGASVALSGDGNVLAVGAQGESGSATGIDGDQADDSAPYAGAVYVFVRDAMDQWSQEAYVKASNTDATDSFGGNIALSRDGNTLAAAAAESSNATGIDGDQTDDSAAAAGAVYVFVRDAMDQWSQEAYVKASNTDEQNWFVNVALSSDGNVLAVGAAGEAGSAVGIGGDQVDASEHWSGAAYVFVRGDMGQWAQRAYVKASNTGAGDEYGDAIAVSGDGNTLAVGARLEDGNANGIGGNQGDDFMSEDAGAVYLY